jgi:hypothetical protein
MVQEGARACRAFEILKRSSKIQRKIVALLAFRSCVCVPIEPSFLIQLTQQHCAPHL